MRQRFDSSNFPTSEPLQFIPKLKQFNENKMLLISSHALQRFKDRTIFPEKKFYKVAGKALNSKLPLPKTYLNIKEYRGQNGIYRNYMGYIFVFNHINNDKQKFLLITLYKP